MSSAERAWVRRVLPAGLRWRLTAWVGVVLLISAGVVFVAVYTGTGAQLRHQMDAEIAGDASELTRALRATPDRASTHVAALASRYIAAQPFGISSTLLFALVPGQPAATNRPEFFGDSKPDPGESSAEQREEERQARVLVVSPTGYSTVTLPDVGAVRLLKRRVAFRDGPDVTIGVAEPLASVAQAQRSVARAFVLAGALMFGITLLASYLIGTRVSLPLRRMAAVAAKVDAGELHPRIRPNGGPGDELRVLADAFNHMLDRLTEAFAGQRAFVADASHELRTPLTVIRGQLEVLASQEEPSGEEVRRVERIVQAEIARISRLVDDLLLLAKAEQPQFLRPAEIDLGPFVNEIWQSTRLLASRRFELDEVPSGTLNADPDRLAQALRNLIGNAIEHSQPEHGLVRLRVAATDAGWIRFVVEDDGAGIPVEQRELIFGRFHRTDAARQRTSGGTGLGLAIVQAIAEAHGGRARAGESPSAGARVELELPGFTAKRAFDQREGAAAVPQRHPADRASSSS